MKVKMKKMILSLVAAVAFSAMAMAQEAKKEAAQCSKCDKTEMLQHRTDRVVKKYGLNEDQAKQLLKLNTAYADKMSGAGLGHCGKHQQKGQCCQQKTDGETGATAQQQKQCPSKEQMLAKRKMMKAERESYNKELQKIMTPEQFARYSNDQKNARQRRQRGKRGGQPKQTV